jgi:hypothetical protein
MREALLLNASLTNREFFDMMDDEEKSSGIVAALRDRDHCQWHF